MHPRVVLAVTLLSLAALPAAARDALAQQRTPASRVRQERWDLITRGALGTGGGHRGFGGGVGRYSAGVALNRQLALSAEAYRIASYRMREPRIGTAITSYSLRADYYVADTTGLYFMGALGGGNVSFEATRLTSTFTAHAGIGYDIRAGRLLSISPYLSAFHASQGRRARLPEFELGIRPVMIEFGVGVRLR